MGGRWGRPERLGSGPGRGPSHAGAGSLGPGRWSWPPVRSGRKDCCRAMALAGKLPELSPRLGQLTRTNSESLLAAVVPHDAPRPDFSRGSGHNFVLLPAARYACGARPVRSRLEHDGPLRDHNGRGRRRCERERPEWERPESERPEWEWAEWECQLAAVYFGGGPGSRRSDAGASTCAPGRNVPSLPS